MRSFFVLGLILVVAVCPAQTTRKLNITFAGSPAGEATYEVKPDGSFKSKSTLELKVATIVSTVTGKRDKNGELTDLIVDQVGPNSMKGQFGLKDGKWFRNAGGKEIPQPKPSSTRITFGNYNPFHSASLMKAVTNPIGKPQSFTVFMLDAGVEAPITVTYLGEKVLPIGTAKRYSLNIGQLSLENAISSDGVVVGEDVPSQKLRFVAPGWEGLYVDPLAAYPELSQPSFGVVREIGIPTKMRDGVTLKVDLVRPDRPGRYPAILKRTPYGRFTEAIDADMWAKRGYVVVVQDCRGRGESEGEWDPFVNEEKDGYDTIDWIAHQSWSDQKVGMIGGSYDGYVQWAAAVEKHPALKCIIPQVSPPDAMSNLPYDHGMFFLTVNLWWARIVADKKADLLKATSMVQNTQALTTLPLSKVDDKVLGKNVPFFDKWLSREGLNKWKGFDFSKRIASVQIPALHISGWWDGDGIGTKMNWATLRAAGRKNQWLIYGPWTHAFNTSSRMGDVNYGTDAILELDSVYLRWFDTWLKGKDVGLEKSPRVKVFVTGKNVWTTMTDWPSPDSKPRVLYLASKGRLLEAPLAKDLPTSYTYDPAKEKASADMAKIHIGEGNTNVTSAKKDPMAFLFTSAPLPKSMVVTGPIEVSISFKTSAMDTDFVASLCDQNAKGEIRAIGQSGKLRASYIGGLDRPRPLVPGKIYVAKISPWDTAHEIKPGHRLVVIIRCSGFPLFARNLGTGEPIKDATRMVIQRNQILHDKVNLSSVRFQVLK